MTFVASPDSKLSWFTRTWLKGIDYLTTELFGGPKVIKLAHVVNLQKAATLAVCLCLMHTHGNWSPTAVTYTAMHGGFGLVWLLKDRVFPDAKWQVEMTVGSTVLGVVAIFLPYLYIPYVTIQGRSACSEPQLLGAVIVYVLGVVLMMGADCQKYFVLRAKKELITDGFFRVVRHPNYLGEMLIYGSFAFVSQDIRPWAVLLYVWVGLMLPYMLRKEASLSRYAGWKAYKARSGFLIPRFG